MNINFDSLKTTFLIQFDSLKNFHFSLFNAVFWIFLFILFLILLRFWGIKKALYFCLTLAALLLAATLLENFMMKTMTRLGGTFDASITRLLSIIIMLFTFLFFVFIKQD
jgi:hypothetical protein